MDKRALRKTMREKRAAITPQERSQYDQRIATKVIAAVGDYQTIACYVSFQSEVDTHAIISELMITHRVVVPRVVNNTTMEFVLLHPHTKWHTSKHGIWEPVDGEVVDICDIDCFITPLLAFDESKHRLGYGGGYYDRIFMKTNAYRIGIAYDIQAVDHVPIEPWDIALHQIITPTSC